MNKFGLFVTVLLAQMATASAVAIASQVNHENKGGNSTEDATKPSSNEQLLTGKQLNAAIRGAIFRNRQQLLSFLSDPTTRSVICTPALNDTYEVFQANLQEEVDVLWDLDIYASKYGLSKKEHEAVNACSAEMEKYLDNFEAWKKLNRDAHVR